MEASRLAFLNGRFEVARDPQGRITQMDILKHQASSSERSGDSGAADSRPWRYRVQSLEAKGFHVTLREESVSPSVCYTVQDLQFTARNVSEDLTASVPVRLEFSVGEGGRFIADGSVIPATPTAEFSLKLDDLSLSSLQPYLGRISRLTLTRGVTSTQGRLTYDGQDALYSGEFAVKDLILTETGEDTPFLTWKSLSGKGMTASGDRLRIKNVTLDAPESAFVIHKDSSTSLQRAFTPEGDQAAPRPPESDKRPEDPSAEGEKAPESPPYLVTIDKVRVSQGKLNFADLSLALPFGARIHRLAGTITGFSSMPGTLSELKLGGQVDEYGLARAAGRIDFLDPTGFTDIAVTFRNVEMTRLTPYSATFAGRKIDSGKLSLDLEYKIKDRQFFGDHKIIMERLSLGERVESPEAVNFPLDLAIAILKDSGGTIHLGLPVSGSLDDPHFSFGGIIWKAFTNIITGIVTSPFRMLGKMLGISGEKLEKVVFDPGNSLLLPPEREKLMELATAMKKRPDLALAITGTFNPTSDLAALRTRQLNRAVLRKMGEKDGYGEDSEPLSLEEPEVKKALERLYADRIGKEALSALQSKYRAANPEPPPTSGFGRASAAVRGLFGEKEVSITPEETSRLKGADLARIMYEDLLSTEDIGEDRLRTLARERATTVRNELIALGLTLDRLTMEAPQKVEGEGREVPVRFTPGSVRASRPDEAATPRPE